MDIELSDEEREIERLARAFSEKELAPFAADSDARGVLREGIVGRLAECGFMGIAVDAELGGVGASSIAYALAMSQIAQGCASTAVMMSVTNMVNEVIAKFGDEHQRERYCRSLCDGTLAPGSFALSEPGAGSDPSAIRTKAVKHRGGYKITGQKQWTTSGDIAGVVVLWARTHQEHGSRGLSCFLVDGEHIAKKSGIRVGRHEQKMGLRASSTVSLEIDELCLPQEALLGEEGQGFAIAMTALDGGRIGIAAQALGIAEAALAEAVRYARERCQFGCAISNFQAIQWMVADCRTELDAARCLMLRAAALKTAGKKYGSEASMAKLYSSEAAWRVCQRALQAHGGYGYTREYPVERHWRDVRVAQIYEGTSEIQRLVIARHLLGVSN